MPHNPPLYSTFATTSCHPGPYFLIISYVCIGPLVIPNAALPDLESRSGFDLIWLKPFLLTSAAWSNKDLQLGEAEGWFQAPQPKTSLATFWQESRDPMYLCPDTVELADSLLMVRRQLDWNIRQRIYRFVGFRRQAAVTWQRINTQ